MKITPVRPNITFFSLSKMLALGLFVSVTLGALAWMWIEILGIQYARTIGVFISVTWFLLASWNWWAWRPRRRNALWHRWLSGFAYVIYLGGYFWLAGVSFWGRILVWPRNLVVVGVLFFLYILVSALPFLSHSLARKLYMLHAVIDRKIINCGGITLIGMAGMIGYWFQKVLEKDSWMIFVSVLGPIIGLGITQHQFYEVWQTRPWAKEEK